MRVIWARGAASVPVIWRDLHAGRGLAQSTVATMVGRLERRGLLERRPDGDVYVYRALVSEEDVRRAMLGVVTDLLFAGEASRLVSHLVETRRLTEDDLAEAEALLKARGAAKKRTRGRDDR